MCDTGNGERSANFVRGPFAEAEIANLALAHDFGQRVHGLFQRRLRVVPVTLVEVDVIRPQPLVQRINLLENLRP